MYFLDPHDADHAGSSAGLMLSASAPNTFFDSYGGWHYEHADRGPRMTHDSTSAGNSSSSSAAAAAAVAASAAATSEQLRTLHMSDVKGPLKHKIDQGGQVYASIDTFVDQHVADVSKRCPIKRLLVATNGIAACRCMLSLRRLLMHLFRDDHAIKFIALTTAQEIQSSAEYLKMADNFELLPDGDNKNNYANVTEIVAKAVEMKVDAVWAGWGHASENPELPRRLHEKGIMFIGPPASAMHALGDKIASTIIAQTLDIPTVSWSGNELKLPNPENKPLAVGDDLFAAACVSDVSDGLRAVERHKIDYPMMIKASEGGGGKGIRRCKNEADFRESFAQVKTEVPNSPIFLMKCIEKARHIEVQLIADRYGTVIPIYTRDCSIQRRCQKIIEEAPASIAPDATLRRMMEDAVKIAQAVGYESAGTVEYLYLPSEDKYYFLELNPRLQVEHPCTEMLASINIPAIQLQIAMGLPLHLIEDIRSFYGLTRYGSSPLPAERVITDTEWSVIAARITSEDPEDFFRPSTGSVEYLNFRSAQNVWGYFSVAAAGKVHEFADSQFGHLFARGRTRHEAVSIMLCALQELELRASFASQVSYLVDLLQEADFTDNNFNTEWLDSRIANQVLNKTPIPEHEMIAVSSALIGHSRVMAAFNNFRNAIARGQVLPTKDLTETFLFDLIKDMSIYKVEVTRTSPQSFLIRMNGTETTAEIHMQGNNSVLVMHKDRSYNCHLEETADKFKVTIGRSLVVFEKDNDPTVLKSPYTGKLIGYKMGNREWVGVGQVYAVVESMKLVFNVEVKRAPGRLEHVAKEGDLLYPGSVIARLVDQKDGDKYRPKPFTDTFVEWQTDAEERCVGEQRLFEQHFDRCLNLLRGSSPPGTEPASLVERLFEMLDSPTLPDAMLNQALTPLCTRLRDTQPVEQAVKTLHPTIADHSAAVREALERYFQGVPDAEWETTKAVCQPLYTVCEKFERGLLSHTTWALTQFLTEYRDCEAAFDGRTYDDAVAELSERYPDDADRVVRAIYSHTQLKKKNVFMVALLRAVEERGMHLVTPLADILRDIGNMFHTEPVSQQCRHLLLQNGHIKYRKFLNKILWDVDKVELSRRDAMPVLPVDEAIEQLRARFGRLVKDGTSVRQIFEKSPWSHKVIHEFFFDPQLADFAIRAYIGLTFNVDSVTRMSVAYEGEKRAEVYNFVLDKDSLAHQVLSSAGVEQRLYVSVVRLDADYDSLAASVTSEQLLRSLANEWIKTGIRTNGARPSLRVEFLVSVHHQRGPVAQPSPTSVRAREVPPLNTVTVLKRGDVEALLEELPEHDAQEVRLVGAAEGATVDIQTRLSALLEQADVAGRVLVVCNNKPMMQTDFVGDAQLELWRLPAGVRLESERLSNLKVYRFDDPADRRYSRLFVRENIELAIRSADKLHDELSTELEAHMDAACGSVNVAMRRGAGQSFVSNHILFHLSFPKLGRSFTNEHTDELDDIIVQAIQSQEELLYKHVITEVEVVYFQIDAGNVLTKRRVKFLNKTGVTPEFGIYNERQGQLEAAGRSHQLYGHKLEAHSEIRKIEKKRAQTRQSGTTYVYDYPSLFGRACLERWRQLERRCAERDDLKLYEETVAKLTAAQRKALGHGDWRHFIEEHELVYRDGQLVVLSAREELRRRADNCNNETGVVAWSLRMFTPERPDGYSAVVIANDITFQSGSFAVREDDVYAAASAYSRHHKLPRCNVSCNSGARIGIAEEIARVFRPKWRNVEKPDEGFDYLYVEPQDAVKLGDQLVTERQPNGLLKIKAVIGKENEAIGVENLQGSGLIAGETSAAYDEVPTYCFVTGRSVGIGAYTARLAHRIVQARTSHLILTGAPALNTLLGKEVYTSNNQLGGVQIMHKNGVTHAVVDNDFEGCAKLVDWMAYLPHTTSVFPFVSSFGVDSQMRAVAFDVAPNRAYDVRQLIDAGIADHFHSGICDAGSFDEIMHDWAKTIVTGRARIGGLPIGVVSSELRNVKTIYPADPAVPNSQAVESHQAGQVWYPDSAFKTAECINDFNREQLPLLFIASLRGFSGGQRDMFDMVLKFGASIVDALRQYRQPVIIYIPAFGELRGGAWAVLDSRINPGFIHMVADSDSRGGILEPPAIVGIKMRGERFRALQTRCDRRLKELEEELSEEKRQAGGNDRSDKAAQLKRAIAARAEQLTPAYRSVSVELADLHDRAERMRAVGAVQHITALSEARRLFHSILVTETAKTRMAAEYIRRKSSDVNWETAAGDERQNAMAWLAQRLEEFHAGFEARSPAEQLPILREFHARRFQELLAAVERDAFFDNAQRRLSRLSPADLDHLEELIQQTKRKLSHA